MIEAFAWSLVAAIALTYAGYPLAVIAMSAFGQKRPWHYRSNREIQRPSINILISAYNEEAHLAAKLESVLDATEIYGPGVRVFVADDGSSDATLAVAQEFEARGVEVIALPRGGKAAALNYMAGIADGDILVFTDADPLFRPDTLVKLVEPFADSSVGAVAGNVVMTTKSGTLAFAGQLYRRYESALRKAEDRLFGAVSADGGLYAIRRNLMPHVPPDGTDDFHISTAAPAARMRIAFAPFACVTETAMSSGKKDLQRRIRITVRGLTALKRRAELMNPNKHGSYALGLFMHKLARRLAPLLIVPLSVVATILAASGSLLWSLMIAAILATAAIATVGMFSDQKLPRILRMPYTLALHLIGLGAGVLLFAAGRRFSTWTAQRTVAS